MKGGKKMRKLNKVNSGRLDTIEAYACVCSCNCSGACTGCGCAVSSAKYTTRMQLLKEPVAQMVTENNFM